MYVRWDQILPGDLFVNGDQVTGIEHLSRGVRVTTVNPVDGRTGTRSGRRSHTIRIFR